MTVYCAGCGCTRRVCNTFECGNDGKRGEAVSVICRLFGHRWLWHPPRYNGCWVNDENCQRCGVESWWPA